MQQPTWTITGVLALAMAAVGWAAHSMMGGWMSGVHAAEVPSAAIAFQLQGTGPEEQLAVYDAANRTISVYQAVNTGADTKRCSYQFVLGRSGADIHRTVCQPGTLP